MHKKSMFLTSIKTKTCGISKQQMKCVYIERKERDRGGRGGKEWEIEKEKEKETDTC